MALKDKLSSFIDNLTGKESYETRPRDVVKARHPVLRGLDKTLDQFENGKTKAPGKWWSVSNDWVAFSPTHNGAPLLVNAQTTNFIPSGQFAAFLGAMKAAVEAGEFDDEIEQLDAGDGSAGGSAQVKMPKASGGRGGYRQSKLPARADNIPHRVPAHEAQPHASYTLNKGRTLWRSPEQVEADDATSRQRLASLKANKG